MTNMPEDAWPRELNLRFVLQLLEFSSSEGNEMFPEKSSRLVGLHAREVIGAGCIS